MSLELNNNNNNKQYLKNIDHEYIFDDHICLSITFNDNNNWNEFDNYKITYKPINEINDDIKLNEKFIHQGTIQQNSIIISKYFVKPREWSVEWNPNTNKGGYIKLNYNTIIIKDNCDVNATGMGYYGDNKYNIGKGELSYLSAGYGTKGSDSSGKVYGNKELNILYHGSGSKSKQWGIGGGTIKIRCNKFINYGNILSNSFKNGSGGTIFIVAKEFNNYGKIIAKSNYASNGCGLGRIAIYSDKYINKGSIYPEPYVAQYNDAINKGILPND